MTNKFLHQKSLSGTPNWGSAQVNASRMAVSNQNIGSFLPLKFFATFLVLFAFGIGSVWGALEITYTSLGVSGTQYSSSSHTFTNVTTIDWTNACVNSSKLRLKASGELWNSAEMPANIDSIVMTGVSYSSNTNAGFYVYGASSAKTETTKLYDGAGTGKIKIDFTSYSYKYFYIKNKSTRTLDESTIIVYYTSGPKHTVTWKVNGATETTTQVVQGSKPSFPDTPTSCDATTSTTFYGWTQTPWSGPIDDISGKTAEAAKIYTDASQMPNVTGAVTYHAVFAKCIYSKISDYTSLSSGDKIVIRDNKNNNIFNNDFTATNDNTSTTTITPLAKQIWTITGNNTDGWTFTSGSATIGFTTAPTSSSKTQSVSNTSTNSSAWKLANLTGTYTGCISIKKSTAVLEYSSGWKVYYNAGDQYAAMQIFQATYSKYLTNCCTSLAQINGSINLSHTILKCNLVIYNTSKVIFADRQSLKT